MDTETLDDEAIELFAQTIWDWWGDPRVWWDNARPAEQQFCLDMAAAQIRTAHAHGIHAI